MSSKATVELMLSTMNRSTEDWLDNLHIQTATTVINQCGKKGEKSFVINGRLIKWFDSDEIGLSKSRNMGLDCATGDILILTDDDLEYIDGYEDIIVDAFAQYPNADIISFQVEGIEERFKSYSPKAGKRGFFSSLHISSVEIALKRESVLESNVRFNERFGAGAEYRMGEENIFLYDCLKNGLKIYYVPKVIARLHIGQSTWFQGYNSKYFMDLGAIYHEMFGPFLGILMLLAFAIKNYKLYHREMGFSSAYANMLSGFWKYKRQC